MYTLPSLTAALSVHFRGCSKHSQTRVLSCTRKWTGRAVHLQPLLSLLQLQEGGDQVNPNLEISTGLRGANCIHYLRHIMWIYTSLTEIYIMVLSFVNNRQCYVDTFLFNCRYHLTLMLLNFGTLAAQPVSTSHINNCIKCFRFVVIFRNPVGVVTLFCFVTVLYIYLE